MIRFSALRLAVLSLALGAPAATAQAPADRSDASAFDAPAAPSSDATKALATGTSVATIAYQGVLSDGGAPIADGSHTIRLRLQDASGTLLYGENHIVNTVDGAFSLAIGSGMAFSGSYDNITFADEVFLRVIADGTVVGPDTPIQAVPHARSLTAGAVIAGEVPGGRGVVNVENRTVSTGSGADTYGVRADSYAEDGTALYGRSYSSNGFGVGVSGQTASQTGIGVYGRTSNSSADAPGSTADAVHGLARSENGHGVYGRNLSTVGPAIGVSGHSGANGLGQSPLGRGVYGFASSPTGATTGVYGEVTSTTGRGVYGTATATSGATTGVYGEVASTGGKGVVGINTATTNTNFGVYGEVASTNGLAVYGLSTATTGSAYGTYGRVASTNGTGAYGFSSATSGTTRGVYGRVNSPDGLAGYFAGGRGISVDAGNAGHGAIVLSGGGSGASTTTVFAENASTADGIAGWFETNGTDASLVAYQRGTGDIFRAIENQNLRFRVRANGDVFADGTFTGGGADLAEYFPLADGASVTMGQVVGLTGGRVSLDTRGAEQIAVISSNPAFIGNPGAEAGGALVALVGQVAVDVAGDAAPGDLLIASGGADGRARAVSPSVYRPADGAVIGRVLTAGADGVVALVGVDEAAALRGVVARQQAELASLRGEVRAIRSMLEARMMEPTAELRREN